MKRVLLLLTVLLLFSPLCARALPGTGHVRDMVSVLLGDAARNPELRTTLAEFTRTIDNFEVIKGLPLGREGHRLYGHWGFNDAIPFNKPPLKDMLQRIAEKEGPQAAEAARQKIIQSWSRDAKNLIRLSEKMLGLSGRAARGFAGLLYSVHLLGDYSGEKLGSLQDLEKLTRDLEKSIHRLLGNNSRSANRLCRNLAEVLKKAPASCDRACLASRLLKELKNSRELQSSLFRLMKARNAFGTLFKNAVVQRMARPSSMASAQKTVRASGLGKVRAVPGVMLPNGRLLTAVSQGAGAGLLSFAFDAGEATFQYMRGEMYTHEYREQITRAALTGAGTAALYSVVAYLVPAPGGVLLAAVSIGGYLVFDYGQTLYKEYQDGKRLTKEDLAMLGIEIESVLDPGPDKYSIFEPEPDEVSVLWPKLDEGGILNPKKESDILEPVTEDDLLEPWAVQ